MNATLKLLPLAAGAMIAGAQYADVAQDNVTTMSNFRTTGSTAQAETIQQGGPTADALRKNLEQIKLPPGFKIELYAIVPEARAMAIEPSTGVVFVGTRKNPVWQVTDRTHQRVASDVAQFASAVTFKVPNGVLYVVEQNRVLGVFRGRSSSAKAARTWRRRSSCRRAS